MTLRTPNILIQSIRTYFLGFLFSGIFLLMFLNWSLYSEGQNIKQAMQNQEQLEAEKEINGILDKTFNELQSSLKSLSEWDEVHQQINDPSYYFFWHDQRLIESAYFKKQYDQLDIYNQNKTFLAARLPMENSNKPLPLTIDNLSPQLIFNSDGETHLNMFEPIYARDSGEIIGYVGVSLNLLSYILSENNFNYVDKTSISFSGNGNIPLTEVMEHINFKSTPNPVTDYLWQLIQEFILQLIALLLVSSIIMSVIFNKLFSHPLAVLSQYLHRLKRNPKAAQQPPQETFYLKELEELKASIHDYNNDLQATQQALDIQNKTVFEQSRRDLLTDIYNRRAFDEAWNNVLINYGYYNVTTTLILFDCDFFKALNDTYGHEVGDEVIRISASTIHQNLPMECPAYRIGGDEFAIIVQNKTVEQTFSIADRCLTALKECNFSLIGIKEKISFSVGVSSVTPRESIDFANDIASLPRQADIAMYKAKQSHENKIQYYHQQLEAEAHTIVSSGTVSSIVNAIHTGKNIKMHFQPIVSLETDRVYFESLIRIQNESELIFPNDIFAVVQHRRLEVAMDKQIIQAILNVLVAGKLPKGTEVAINISGKTLLQPDFISLFNGFIPYLKKYKLVIEVTEQFLRDHMEYAQEALNQLRQQGFLIALDNFGSGYSSIGYLAHMPVDIIKFDMSMTIALKSDKKTQNIIQSTAEMVLRSGYELVMKGIEDQEMYDKAKRAGATHLQGYLLGKPNIEPLMPRLPNHG